MKLTFGMSRKTSAIFETPNFLLVRGYVSEQRKCVKQHKQSAAGINRSVKEHIWSKTTGEMATEYALCVCCIQI